MTILGFQDLTLPVLEEITRRGETRTNDLVQAMADWFNLTTEERTTLLPSGRQTVIANRVHWAIAYLSKAILLERTRRAHYRIAERGQQVLASPPPRIDPGSWNAIRRSRPSVATLGQKAYRQR